MDTMEGVSLPSSAPKADAAQVAGEHGSSTANGAAGIPAMSWLEDALLAERQEFETFIARRHALLLQHAAPSLQGVKFHTQAPLVRGATAPISIWGKALHNQSLQSGLPNQLDNDVPRQNSTGSSQRQNSAGSSMTPRNPPSLFRKKARSVILNPPRQVKSMDGRRCCPKLLYNVERLVTSPVFEAAFCLLILLNAIFMAVEAQHRGVETGSKLGYNGAAKAGHHAWPGAIEVFKVMEWVFGLLFTVELVLKVTGMGIRFFAETWNLLDLAIVACWLFSSLGASQLPKDAMLLRLARLGRLLRLLKLVRTIKVFDSLYLMTTAIEGSILMLFWSVAVLTLVQMMLAFILQHSTESYILNEQNLEEKRMEVFKYYGTFVRSILTMFEITLGNWMVPARALIEHVSEWYMIFVLAHKLVIGFSVVSVLTGVFIQETFRVATTDDRIMVMTKERARKFHSDKMTAFFGIADDNADGVVDFVEFQKCLENEDLRTWLESMELDVTDPGLLFLLLDTDGDGRVSHEDLIDGVDRLKGAARSYEVCHVQQSALELMRLLRMVLQHLHEDSHRGLPESTVRLPEFPISV